MASLKKKPATRKRIEHAALAVFAQRGYAGTSMDAVAVRAGVGHGTVFWHFKSKANLYRDVVRGVGDRLIGTMQNRVDSGPRTVGEVVVRGCEVVVSDPKLVGLLADLAGNRNDPEVEYAARGLYRRLADFLARKFAANGADGAEDGIALLVVAMLSGLATTRLEGLPGEAPLTAFAAVIESLAAIRAVPVNDRN